MNKKSLNVNLIVLTVVFVGLVFSASVNAQQRLKMPFGASKQKTVQLNLTKEAGPWLIMCASFDGLDGRQQAINLADELRKTNGLTAYVYRQHFDFSADVADRGLGLAKPTTGGRENVPKRKMKLLNQSEKTEYAVLVGNYKSDESSKAQRDLAIVKKLQPESMRTYSAELGDTPQAGNRLRADSEALFGTNAGFKRMSTSAADSKFPLRLAILVTNPMVPEQVRAQATVDHYILGLNRGRKYSLLNNPKPYTLKIASFSGEVIVRPQDSARESDRLWRNKKFSSKEDTGLVQAAKRAKILTEYLRSKNVEAYVFHDRFSSYVCVGGFDWVRKGDGPDAVANPEVTQLAKVFAAKPVGGGQVTTIRLPARLLEAGVTCDANPFTVAVPHKKGRVASLPSGLR